MQSRQRYPSWPGRIFTKEKWDHSIKPATFIHIIWVISIFPASAVSIAINRW